MGKELVGHFQTQQPDLTPYALVSQVTALTENAPLDTDTFKEVADKLGLETTAIAVLQTMINQAVANALTLTPDPSIPGLLRVSNGGTTIPTDVITEAGLTVELNSFQQNLLKSFVTFLNHDGSPVVGKNVFISLTSDGSGIDDISLRSI